MGLYLGLFGSFVLLLGVLAGAVLRCVGGAASFVSRPRSGRSRNDPSPTRPPEGPAPSRRCDVQTHSTVGVSLDRARDVMIALAADGKISFLNRAFEKSTGLACREWQGRAFTTLVHAADWGRVGELLKRLADGESPPAVERVFSPRPAGT